MSSMGLDLGTTFGYAFSEGRHGSFQLKKKPKEPVGVRYTGFSVWLQSIAPDVHTIYYEDVKNHVGILASHMYGGYLAVLQMFAYRHNIELIPIGVGTVKKFATGKGNASKEEMIAAAVQLGYSPNDDNEADAIHILRCGMAQKGV